MDFFRGFRRTSEGRDELQICCTDGTATRREKRTSDLEPSLGDAPGGVIETHLNFEFHVIRFTGL